MQHERITETPEYTEYMVIGWHCSKEAFSVHDNAISCHPLLIVCPHDFWWPLGTPGAT